MTLAMVAEKLGRYQSFVSTIQQDQRRIDFIEYFEIAAAIGYSAAKKIGNLAIMKQRLKVTWFTT